MITILLRSHRLSLSPSIFLSSSTSLFPPLSLPVFSLLSLCPPPHHLLPLSYRNMVSMALSQMPKSFRIGLGFAVACYTF